MNRVVYPTTTGNFTQCVWKSEQKRERGREREGEGEGEEREEREGERVSEHKMCDLIDL